MIVTIILMKCLLPGIWKPCAKRGSQALESKDCHVHPKMLGVRARARVCVCVCVWGGVYEMSLMMILLIWVSCRASLVQDEDLNQREFIARWCAGCCCVIVSFFILTFCNMQYYASSMMFHHRHLHLTPASWNRLVWSLGRSERSFRQNPEFHLSIIPLGPTPPTQDNSSQIFRQMWNFPIQSSSAFNSTPLPYLVLVF